ncbi:MAG: DHHA1 domain-containing protein [Nitrososphaerota archaeon]
MDRNEAEKLYGFTLYQGGEVPSAVIRVVEIPGWDVEACGGIHCENTEDVGIIKIVRTERIQDGVERLIFTAGPAALPQLQINDKIIHEASAILETPPQNIGEKLTETLNELKEIKRKLKTYFKIVAKSRASELSEKSLTIDGVEFYVARELEDDKEYSFYIVDELINVSKPRCVIVVFGSEKPNILVIANYEAQKRGVNAGKLAEKLAEKIGGKAGGQSRLGQGVLSINIDEETLKKVLLEVLKQK